MSKNTGKKRNPPNPEAVVGVIYYEILTPKRGQTSEQVNAKMEKKNHFIGIKNTSSRLTDLVKRGFATKEKNKAGMFEYKACAITNELGVPRFDPINTKEHAKKGHNIDLLVKFMKKNIGVMMPARRMAKEAGVHYSSAVGVTLTKMAKRGWVEYKRGPNGYGQGFAALPVMANYVHGEYAGPKPATTEPATPTPVAQLPLIAAPEPQPTMAPLVNPLDNLAGSFQQILDQHTENVQFKQALLQIAGILASVGIIDAA